ncbi:MAG: SWIM zinc finger family protein [Leptolyngbya sp. IPPAS B-1204]|uniref:Metal-binding protein n=1 Tax=Leptolyngbya sp. NK1-12 TaxID=2547451 RepID=A0AA96WEB4_9CYAN|nr:SWIM zinc finger family protein [Elainella sp. C42_A2020_010]RNJ69288.1 MAG: metal-binding protein [Leptolyngbya sp. IPPAS B-1204]WNZ23529.1 metal-binding protein [Leptolyngbya sp. NK1-12]
MTYDTQSYDTQSNREWWAQRWVDVLESFGWVRRLARARNYAREGNVLKIEFQGAKVQALVQGTAPEPYRVSLSLDPFDDEQWQYVIESLSERAIFSAKLLAGEMPQNIEEVFTANGLSLFPLTKFDIHSKCSCPDPANPCKHIGAVYYVLGDRFSEDPFVLFQLRGRTKEQIITALRQMRSTQAESVSEISEATSEPQIDLQSFWQYNEQLEPSLVVITPPPSSETVLDLLGPIPLKSDISTSHSSAAAQLVLEHLKGIYAQVSQQAVMTAMTAGNQET